MSTLDPPPPSSSPPTDSDTPANSGPPGDSGAAPTASARSAGWGRWLRTAAVLAVGVVVGHFAPMVAGGVMGLRVVDVDESVAWPLPASQPKAIRIIRDRVFATYAVEGRSEPLHLTMDVYLPSALDDGAEGAGVLRVPMMVGFHGGGFIGGCKEDYAPFARALAERGIAAATPNYRLYGVAPMPACVMDAKCAVRFLRAHADEFGLDPSRIGAMGRSAGGFLALMLGTTAGDPTLEGDGGWQGVDSSVSLVISEAGPTDFSPHLWDGSVRGGALENYFASVDPLDLSPARRVTAQTPPTLLFHGSRDGTIPYAHGRIMELALHSASRPVRLVSFAGTDHDPLFWHWERGLREIFHFIRTHWPH